MRQLSGACHCGTLSYRLDWPDDGQPIPARRCDCSYCTRFNGTWTSHPEARLEILEDASHPAIRYRFGTATADFLSCSLCGISIAAISNGPQGLIAVVNINSLDIAQCLEFDACDSHFGEESLEQRLKRRHQRWIGKVKVCVA